MDMENCTFPIKAHIQASLPMARQRGLAVCFTLMAIFMLGIGEMIRRMGLANICRATRLCSRVIGKMMKEVDLASRPGQMELFFRDNIAIIRKMGKENLDGLMGTNMLASLKIIVKMDKV